MGAWGTDTFDNDVSEDWLDEFLEEPAKTKLNEAFDDLNDEGTGDSDVCWRALAAAEVVAALSGKPAEALPDELQDWLAETDISPSATTIKRAGAAVARILKSSEVAELCGDDEEWQRTMHALLRRLGREPRPQPKSGKSSFRLNALHRRLQKMTGRAGLAFSVRCVLRVQPLIQRCEDIPRASRARIDELIDELIAGAAGDDPPAATTHAEVDARVERARQDWDMLNECADLTLATDRAARAACAALKSALIAQSNVRREGIAGDFPQQAAQEADGAARFAGVKTLRPLSADFRYLEEHFPLAPGQATDPGPPIDVTTQGPLGPLWGNSPPEWFPDRSAVAPGDTA